MRQKPFGWALLIAGIVGWLASATLTLERLALFKDSNHVASCDFGLFVSCTSLMKTEQAALFGFPNPFLGIVGFAVLITIAVVLLTGATLPRWFFNGLQAGVTAAFALVTFFWITSVFVVMTLCPWCMVVWSMIIPLFFLTTAFNIYNGNLVKNPSKGLKEFVSGWWWIFVIFAVVGVVGSIFASFAQYIF
jgi:uncharacterized membrane protein